ncbi:MAG: peptidoglycan endopeptidase [Comamonadaceae bacterium]|nr:MAG: peptidoglycan endopeptidase [Comamonadaceae bacterium]
MRETALAALILMFVCAAHAAPAQDQLGADGQPGNRGLLDRIEHASHVMADRTSDMVIGAMGFLGVPYKRGGNTAETGFDCSGFVRAMYDKSMGLILPRRAEEQAAATQKIDRSELKPGDLVFFNTMRRAFSHVGIYVGDGKFIHSPRAGAEVRVESMNVSYWQRRFNGARRVAEAQSGE